MSGLDRISNMTKIVRRSGVAICLICDLLDWIPDYVLQVGLGMEAHEAPVMREMWPNVALEGWEGHPRCYEAVSKVYPGKVHQLAMSDKPGSGLMYAPPRHADGASLFEPEATNTASTISVLTSTLDIETQNGKELAGKNVILWLDCEGSELNVLRGAGNVLQHVQMINVEMTAKPHSSKWCSAGEVHRFLNDHSFYRQWIHTQRTSAGQVDGIYVRRGIFDQQYCCCPCQVEKVNGCNG